MAAVRSVPQHPDGVGVAFGVFSGASIPIVLTKPIGKPKPTGGRTAVDLLRIPIQSRSEKNMLTDTEKQIIAVNGQTEQQFLDAKRWDGHVGVMGRAKSFPDHKPDRFGDDRSPGMPMKPARDGGPLRGGTEAPKLPPDPNSADQPSDLDQASEYMDCALGRGGKCRHGDLDHVVEARRLLNRNNKQRGGAAGVRFQR